MGQESCKKKPWRAGEPPKHMKLLRSSTRELEPQLVRRSSYAQHRQSIHYIADLIPQLEAAEVAAQGTPFGFAKILFPEMDQG